MLFKLLLIPSVDAYVPLRHLPAVRGNRTSWFDEDQEEQWKAKSTMSRSEPMSTRGNMQLDYELF